jgi:hypothetical protein
MDGDIMKITALIVAIIALVLACETELKQLQRPNRSSDAAPIQGPCVENLPPACLMGS